MYAYCLAGLFRTQTRAKQGAFATASNWLWSFLLAFFTMFINEAIVYYDGVIFACIASPLVSSSHSQTFTAACKIISQWYWTSIPPTLSPLVLDSAHHPHLYPVALCSSDHRLPAPILSFQQLPTNHPHPIQLPATNSEPRPASRSDFAMSAACGGRRCSSV